MEMATPPKVARWMVEMQMEHALPINITIGEHQADFKLVTLRYKKEDEKAFLWMIEKCLGQYINYILGI